MLTCNIIQRHRSYLYQIKRVLKKPTPSHTLLEQLLYPIETFYNLINRRKYIEFENLGRICLQKLALL